MSLNQANSPPFGQYTEQHLFLHIDSYLDYQSAAITANMPLFVLFIGIYLVLVVIRDVDPPASSAWRRDYNEEQLTCTPFLAHSVSNFLNK
ncbi:MAG: hypothetical protein A2162_01465 [Deltaproteobacteria bacterium RBG_13_52_11b]|nr:MAG: hypothetical protein A2162_01465 [Deltaproteobacteria bacterium RBG_13_52_11b]